MQMLQMRHLRLKVHPNSSRRRVVLRALVLVVDIQYTKSRGGAESGLPR